MLVQVFANYCQYWGIEVSNDRGYPRLRSEFLFGSFKAVSSRQLDVNGYPASLTQFDSLQPGGPHQFWLLIKPRDLPVDFEFVGATDEDHINAMKNELQHVAASFRLEKVR